MEGHRSAARGALGAKPPRRRCPLAPAQSDNGLYVACALETAPESPLGQIAMVPMLAWIAKSGPNGLKATYFAVVTSFTDLALSAAQLVPVGVRC